VATVAKHFGLIFQSIFLGIGLLVLAIAVYLTWSTHAWLGRSLQASGVVVENVRMQDRQTGNLMFAPLIRFQTADGRTIEFQSSLRTNPPSYSPGQSVTVLYDPAKPVSAEIANLFSIWFAPMVLWFLGTVFTAVGIGVAVYRRRIAGGGLKGSP
jgi:hypothetical protein